MAKYKPGLHKDVGTIFNGVWNTQLDNVQQLISPASLLDCMKQKPLILERQAGKTRRSKSADASKASEQEWNRWFLFSPKKRRERKRLLSISRYLLPFK